MDMNLVGFSVFSFAFCLLASPVASQANLGASPAVTANEVKIPVADENNLESLKSEDLAWGRARQLLDQHKYDDFSRYAKRFLDKYPQSTKRPYLMSWLAQVPRWKGDPTATISALTDLIDQNNLDATLKSEIVFVRAQAMLETGDYDRFNKEADRILEENVGANQASQLRLWQAMIPRLQGRPKDSITMLVTFLADDRNQIEYLEQAAMIQLQCYTDVDDIAALSEASNAFFSRFPHSPHVATIKQWMIALPAKQGNPAQSVALANDYLKNLESSSVEATELRVLIAAWLLEAGQKDEAIAAVSALARDFPHDERVYVMRMNQILDPKLYANKAERLEALKAFRAEENIPESIRTEVDYTESVMLFEMQDYESLQQSAESFIANHSESGYADQLELWIASIPQWQGNAAASADRLKEFLEDPTRPEVLVEQAMMQRMQCLYTSSQFAASENQSSDYRARFPQGPNLEAITYFEAMGSYLSGQSTQGIDRLSTFLESYPHSEFAAEVSYSRIRALHEAHRWSEIDMAVRQYQEKFSQKHEAEFVDYIQMLVPLNGDRRGSNLDLAIERCENFKRQHPDSMYALDADLNRAIALCIKAQEIEMQDESQTASEASSQSEAVDSHSQEQTGENIKTKAREAMQAFRRAAAADEKSPRHISILDSYFYEGDFSGLEASARNLLLSENSEERAAASLYLGIALARKDEPDLEGAIAAFHTAIAVPAQPRSYGEYILADAVHWMLTIAVAKNDRNLAVHCYQMAQNLPEISLKQEILQNCEALKRSGLIMTISPIPTVEQPLDFVSDTETMIKTHASSDSMTSDVPGF